MDASETESALIELDSLDLNPMPSQPTLPTFVIRHGAFQAAPEFRCVVCFMQVDQFVDDDVFGDRSGQQHRLPIEVEPVALAAGTPAVAKVLDLDAGRVDLHP